MPQKTRKQHKKGGARAKSMRKSLMKSFGKSMKSRKLSNMMHSIKFPHVNRTIKASPLGSMYIGSMKLQKKAARQASRAAHKAHLAQQAAMKEVARMGRIARGENSNSNNNNHKASNKSHKRNVGLNYITRMMSTGKSFVGLINKQNKPKSTRKRANKMHM